MRPAERFRKQLRGQSHIVQHDIGVQGGVAEQYVQQLAAIAVSLAVEHHGDGQSDPHLEEAVGELFDRFHLPDDIGQDGWLVDRLDRHFHALFDRDGLGSCLDRGGGVGMHMVDGG